MCVYMYVRVCVCVCAYIRVRVCVRACVCIYNIIMCVSMLFISVIIFIECGCDVLTIALLSERLQVILARCQMSGLNLNRAVRSISFTSAYSTGTPPFNAPSSPLHPHAPPLITVANEIHNFYF